MYPNLNDINRVSAADNPYMTSQQRQTRLPGDWSSQPPSYNVRDDIYTGLPPVNHQFATNLPPVIVPPPVTYLPPPSNHQQPAPAVQEPPPPARPKTGWVKDQPSGNKKSKGCCDKSSPCLIAWVVILVVVAVITITVSVSLTRRHRQQIGLENRFKNAFRNARTRFLNTFNNATQSNTATTTGQHSSAIATLSTLVALLITFFINALLDQ